MKYILLLLMGLTSAVQAQDVSPAYTTPGLSLDAASGPDAVKALPRGQVARISADDVATGLHAQFAGTTAADASDGAWLDLFGGTPTLQRGSSAWFWNTALAYHGGALFVGSDFYGVGGQPACGVARWDGTRWDAPIEGEDCTLKLLQVSDFASSGASLYVAGGNAWRGDTLVHHVARWTGAGWETLGGGIASRALSPPPVLSLAVREPDVFVGGWFERTGDGPASNIARWNGQAWEALGSGVDGIVFSIALFGQDLWAGGRFAHAGGQPAGGLARWDGTAWHPVSTDGEVYSIVANGSELYVGGRFTRIGSMNARNVARWDGQRWSTVGEGVDRHVYGLALDGPSLYAVGAFLEAGGSAARRIARWDGQSWSPLGSGLSYLPSEIVVESGRVHVMGTELLEAGGRPVTLVAQWDGTSWLPLDEGSNFGLNGEVADLATQGRDLYVAGRFSNAGGHPACGIARWNGTAWHALGEGPRWGAANIAHYGAPLVDYAPGDCGAGNVLVADKRQVYVAARRGGTPDDVHRWDGTAWNALPFLGGVVNALALQGDTLYAGGALGWRGIPGLVNVARWTGMRWEGLGSGPNAHVLALVVKERDVYVGGYFTEAGGVPAEGIARWDGTAWHAVGTGLRGWVRALAVHGDELYAGGMLRVDVAGGGNLAPNVAKWNGATWEALGSGTNGEVADVLVHGGHVYISGLFSKADGKPMHGVARLEGGGWQPLGSGLNIATLSKLTTVGDTLFVGGFFSQAGGTPANNLAARQMPELSVATEPDPAVRYAMALHPNYPNPFNGSTGVVLDLPGPVHVRLAVYDLTGREVARIADRPMIAGRHHLRFEAGALASGVYIYRVETGDLQVARRMVVVR